MKTPTTLFLASAALIEASYIPAFLLEDRAAAVKCQPIDYTFQANVPYVNNAQSPTTINFGGFTYKLPKSAQTGQLVSFFGNIYGDQTKTAQVTTTNSTSTSNSDPNASSYTNGTASANPRTIITTTYSQGNASTGAAGGAAGSTSTSSSSSGAANSTVVAVANELGDISIFTDANTANASNQQSIENQRAATAATSCAADNEHATAEAQEISSVTYTSSSGITYDSNAYAACSAGVVAPSSSSSTGSSSSGSEASVSQVTAQATCNGVTTTNTQQSTSYKVIVKGQYCPANAPVPGFSGAIAGQRVAKSSAEC